MGGDRRETPMIIIRDVNKLISELDSIACNKCEGTSYWCQSCTNEEKIKELIKKHTVGPASQDLKETSDEQSI